MSTLERAIEIAARAHAEQYDPSGEPYILHPLRMMLKLTAPDDRIVAVLHDVIEKGDDWSIERLRLEGFSSEVLEALQALTKASDEEFYDHVKRAGQNRIGRVVKRADIDDHLKNFPMGEHSTKFPGAMLILEGGG